MHTEHAMINDAGINVLGNMEINVDVLHRFSHKQIEYLTNYPPGSPWVSVVAAGVHQTGEGGAKTSS